MLVVQEYLKQYGISKLKDEFDIAVNSNEWGHIFNYNHLFSPKRHIIADDCRALILDHDFNLIARSFPRFYNYNNEVFEDFSTQEKIDGSLILVFFHNNEWRICTRGSFATNKILGHPFTTEELVKSILNVDKLFKGLTYIFELTTPYLQIVKLYPTTSLHLLTIFDKYTELTLEEASKIANTLNLKKPTELHFKNIIEVKNYIDYLDKDVKEINEGVVLRDKTNKRTKLKTDRYFHLHHLKGQQDNLLLSKNLLPLIIKGDIDDYIAQFPYIKDRAIEIENWFKSELLLIKNLYETNKNKPLKEFAISIKNKSKFNSILFDMKKNNIPFYNIEKKYAEYFVKGCPL